MSNKKLKDEISYIQSFILVSLTVSWFWLLVLSICIYNNYTYRITFDSQFLGLKHSSLKQDLKLNKIQNNMENLEFHTKICQEFASKMGSSKFYIAYDQEFNAECEFDGRSIYIKSIITQGLY